jgi:hypothetical protein
VNLYQASKNSFSLQLKRIAQRTSELKLHAI